jgi:ligand-binding sensor domain-containing protein/signal transduction histidine kinase
MFFRNLICIAGVVCICLHFQSCNEKSSGYEIGDSGIILNPQLKKISGFDSLSFHSVPVMLTDVKFKAEKAAPNFSNNLSIQIPKKNDLVFGSPFKVQPHRIKLLSDSSIFLLKMPECVPVKDMATKLQNSESFSYFDKLQGLKQSFVPCMLEDNSGNLWFGTHGGGLTRFDANHFTHFTQKEGLAGNSIFAMIQAKDGCLWISTYGKGLSVFDGKNFRNFSTENGFPSDYILSILEDRNQNIWIGTQDAGLLKIEKSKSDVIYQYNTKNGFFHDNITALMEDAVGNIWVGSEGKGFMYFDNKMDIRLPKNNNISSLAIANIKEDSDGHYWLSAYGNGLFKIEKEKILHYEEKNGFPSDLLTFLDLDKQGNVWVATDGKGVIKMSHLKSDFQNLQIYDATKGLSNDKVYSILQDKAGTFWFGTNRGGVNKFNGNKFTHIQSGSNESANFVFSMTEDKENNIWVATGGDGIIKYSRNIDNSAWNKQEEIKVINGLSSNYVYCSHTDKRNRKWFGTDNGVNILDHNNLQSLNKYNGFCGNKVTSILEDSKGNFWFGLADPGGIAMYDGKQVTCMKGSHNFVKSAIFSIAEDNSGRIWFATEDNGIFIKDGHHFYTFNDLFSDFAIFSIKKDADGNMWIATEGNGLYVYDGSKFYNIDETLGLSNNFVFSIFEDHNQDMWFGTRFGLNTLTKDKKTSLLQALMKNTPLINNYFTSYSYEDGFLGVGCNRGAIYQTSDHTMWIGTTDRLTLSHLAKKPSHLDTSNDSLRLYLTNIDLFNEKVNWVDFYKNRRHSQKINNRLTIENIKFSDLSPWYLIPQALSLKYNNNYLTFNYGANSANKSAKIKYQYKLIGFEDNWSQPTRNMSASYGNLPYGKYNFQLKAEEESGLKSEIFEYSFTIRPPWWYSWWAYLLYSVLFIAFLRYIHKLQKERTIRIERERNQLQEIEKAKEIATAYKNLETAHENLENTHLKLKSTQAQLIQSEKMASLGELIAGIAHEIQNPLNFVNNFSELSVDLTKELKEEVEKLDIPEKNIVYVNEIIGDLSINQEKINHHGKRASDIVNSMLQHSRTSTGQKEWTDLNALTDEYLRLAYHGLRAKDKTFNAELVTNFDANLPKIEVIPQDIGRVILNLFTNAFYAVNEKNKQVERADSLSGLPDGQAGVGGTGSHAQESNYEPKVTVSTRLAPDNHLQIVVQDNGPGIPDAIKDKIFQPFFTTKPTGQGTGLGLSLSYDIVKAHGGELKVESLPVDASKNSGGTTFIISLPIA